MTFDEFLSVVGDPEGFIRTEFAPHWEGMMQNFPPDRYAKEFLTDDAIRAHWELSPQHPESLAQLLEMAKRIRNDRTLLSLAALMHWALFASPTSRGAWVPYPPTLASQQECGLFNFVLALGFLFLFDQKNRDRGIPENVIRDTLKQVACYDFNFRRAYGTSGIFTAQLCWLHAYFPPARFFRIERLEFCQGIFRRPFRVYRHRETGRQITLCEAGLKFLPNGRLCATDAPYPKEALETTFSEDGERICGHQVGPLAQLSVEPISLPATEWETIVAQGDPVLDMHIPSGGNMTPDLIQKSLEQAVPFFDEYFPDNGVRAIACGSWLFSSQLHEILPAESHILTLQSHFQLLPCAPDKGTDNLWFLFLQSPPYDLTKLPRDTSMRRAMIKWLEGGGCFCSGAGVLPVLRAKN